MRGGKLRCYVAFYQCVQTRNAVGELTTDPATFPLLGYVWARISPLSGQEAAIAKNIRADITHEIETRPTFFAVSPKDQIRYQGRTFEIVSRLNIDERNRQIKYSAVEVAI